MNLLTHHHGRIFWSMLVWVVNSRLPLLLHGNPGKSQWQAKNELWWLRYHFGLLQLRGTPVHVLLYGALPALVSVVCWLLSGWLMRHAVAHSDSLRLPTACSYSFMFHWQIPFPNKLFPVPSFICREKSKKKIVFE